MSFGIKMKTNKIKKYTAQALMLAFLCIALSSCEKMNLPKELSLMQVNSQSVKKGESPKEELVEIVVDEQLLPEKPLEEPEEEMVLISVENFGRSNPFKPYYEKSLVLEDELIKQLMPSIPQPPGEKVNDSALDELLSIKIAGILYDSKRPLAIVKINSQDYLVHKGDKIFDYFIQEITKTKVAVQRGSNVYKAGVGEIIEGSIESNKVYDLSNMFAGHNSGVVSEQLGVAKSTSGLGLEFYDKQNEGMEKQRNTGKHAESNSISN